jgi:two-component system chemotaxis sensor kinase CheA
VLGHADSYVGAPDVDAALPTPSHLEKNQIEIKRLIRGEPPPQPPPLSSPTPTLEKEKEKSKIEILDFYETHSFPAITPPPHAQSSSLASSQKRDFIDSLPETSATEKRILEELHAIEDTLISPSPLPPPLPPPSSSSSSPSESKTDFQVFSPMTTESLRIPMKKIDDIIDLMGEIAIIKDKLENKLFQSSRILSQLKQMASPEEAFGKVVQRYTLFHDEFSQDAAELELVSNELKHQALDVKMVPLSTILTDFAVFVRNKSFELGKNVAPLHVFGGETKVDKSLLEALRKMLIHLISNALIHGIEKEEERVKREKIPMGRLSLRAFTKSDTVIIEVEDDGAGLNATKLKKKAMEQGLISEEEALGMTDKDAFYLITLPGFSTSSEVTKDSGRGVGMDMVYTTIHQLKGSLMIESELGKYTRTSMIFPVNLSIINAFLILVQQNVLAIPLNYVKETYSVTRDQLRIQGGLSVFQRTAQKMIPVISLAQYLQYPALPTTPEKFLLLILSYQNEELAVSVDHYLRIQEIILKPLSGALKEHPILAGATILRTGEPSVILNVATIFQRRKKWSELRLPLHRVKEPLARCLVVDNSEMTLMVLKNILKSAEYSSLLASSSKEAQKIYSREEDLDLVILNSALDHKEQGGLELLEWIRQKRATQKIVVISNSSSKELTRLCYQQGADFYCCKLGFQSQNFLEKVKFLLECRDD